MSNSLIVRRAGPAMTVQDLGRPGHMGDGLSIGGAADRTAFIEGVALLGQSLDCAAIEMASLGGDFTATEDIRIALTGAPMKAALDGEPLVWNASHLARAGQTITITSAVTGVYGYLHVGGGLGTQSFLGSRATHLASGIGKTIENGEELVLNEDQNRHIVNNTITAASRFQGGEVRVVPSVQTHLFSSRVIERFQATKFTRTSRGNRQGVELGFDGAPFSTESQLSILSEPMIAGDIQMTGDGMPFVLLPECQTTGGYPRIATVLPADLSIVSQAGAGTKLTFKFIDFETALATYRTSEHALRELRSRVRPRVRNPHEMRDLLRYELIDGVVDATK